MFQPKSLFIQFCLASLTLSAFTSAYAENSINCSKAQLPDEKAICHSVELQKLDVKMTTLFEVSEHLMAMGSRGTMQDRQYVWLKNRHMCKTNTACLKQSYNDRIDELNQGLEDIYSRGPF